MTELFFFNNDGECERSSPSIVSVTTAGRFDPDYVDTAIMIPRYTSGASQTGIFAQAPQFLDGSVSTLTLNTRFDFYAPGSGVGSAIFMAFPNSSGQHVIRFRIATTAAAATITVEYWNGSTYVFMGTFIYSTNTLSKMVVNLTAGASGVVEIYLGGTLVLSASGMHVAVNNFGPPVWYNVSSSQESWISQVVGATYDVSDTNVISRRPNGNGARTDGTGTFTDVNTIPRNDATAINLPTVGAKRTFTKSAITVPSGKIVKAVSVNGLVRASSPAADVKAILTIAGADYQAPGAMGATVNTRAKGNHWVNHPVTGVPFTAAELDAVEAYGYEVI